MTRQSALLELRPSRFRLPRQLSLLFFPRAKDGLADTPHRSLRYFSRPLGTFVDHLEHARRMPLELHATLPHRPDPFNQMVRHFCFALDAADSRRAATIRGPLQRLWGREQFMPVVHRTDIRVSRIATPLPGRVDRKSTRLNSSHGYISYAVFCLKKKRIRLNHYVRTAIDTG